MLTIAKSTGNVGIGTTSPQAPLHVIGPNGNYGQLGTVSEGVYGSSSDVGVTGFNPPAGNYGWLGASGGGVQGGNIASGNYGQLGTAAEGVIGTNGSFHNYGRLGTSEAGVEGVNGEFGTHGQLGQYDYGVYGRTTPGKGGWAGGFFGDVTIESDTLPLSCVRIHSDGVVVKFFGMSGLAGSITISGNSVSYNDFTGSHCAWTVEKLERGSLVRLTGWNRLSGDNPNSEVIYGVVQSRNANDSRCLGSFLGLQEPSKAVSRTNSYLVMAVGNGDMWVTDGGSGDVEPGNYLISSDVPGCAMKDDPERFPIGYICARAAEGVKWSEVAPDAGGVMRKKISVLFETFVRDSRGAHSTALAQSQQKRIDALESEVKSLRTLQGRLASLEARLESNHPNEITPAVAKNGGDK